MTLKAVLDNLDGLDAAVANLYKKDDASGKFKLDVEGLVPKASLDEFRNNNINLNNQLKTFTELGLDVEQIKAAKKVAQDLAEKKLIAAGDIDGVVTERFKGLKKEYEDKIAELEGSKAKNESQLSVLMIDNEVRKAATKAGILPTATDDVLLRARNVFKIQDGSVVAMDGDKPLYGKDGVSAMGVEEYVTGLSTTAPHLFQQSTGTGSKGNQGNYTQNGGANLTANQKIAKGLEERR